MTDAVEYAVPLRIQRKRAKGWRIPPSTVCVSRPGYFGNPFVGPRAAALYRRWLSNKMGRKEFAAKVEQPFVLFTDKRNVMRELPKLHGKNLACWCRLCEKHKDGKPLGETCTDCEPCHADVLLEIANR